ncbi:N-acetylglucosamine-6-phosphate deacetylase [Occallatibacter riparius]|uniref:N-acetylglucosamine-6-phosphate deacetylase n=1 Tax=Occallatibacter riparius TaxID=1002689 RepID=A0A9J7BVB6_9BACT|nr:N-acetylglucosamine-6-phosphate deacetylase [Occallatibacter riparius]UWZ86820.1 N-acetylglucosamine-6-phosphate deacetylase [Occallatibacter riparius]
MHNTLVARTLLLHDRAVDFPVLDMDEEGRLTAIGTDPKALAHESTVLGSGLFDVHMHGATGIDVMTADDGQMRAMRRFLARHGVAYFLPTTVTAPVDFTLQALERMARSIAEARDRDRPAGEAAPLGIHIEGPFLSHSKRGMHPSQDLQPPSLELFDRLQAAAGGMIRMMTIAPEADAGPYAASEYERVSAVELIRHATAQGVACSVGHSNASSQETLTAIEAGAVSATHTFNAMRPLNHRDPGILGVVLDDDRLFADLICDGVHVAAEAVRLWWKCKGPNRAILITDALPGAGMGDGKFMVGDEWVTADHGRALVTRDLEQGIETLAGSVLMLNQAVRKFMECTSACVEQGVRLASHNPAAMLRGNATHLAPGDFVNLTRWDQSGRLLATYLRGREIPAAS